MYNKHKQSFGKGEMGYRKEGIKHILYNFII